MRPSARPVALLSVLLLLVSGCTGSAGVGSDDGPVVLVTTSVLGALTEEVVAGTDSDLVVDVLMPPGADPHTYAPSAADARRVGEAALVIANGLGLEVAVADVLGAAADDGVRIVEVGPAADPIELDPDLDDHEGESEEEHAEHAEAADPHVWLDPDRVALLAAEIAVQLAEVAPDDAEELLASGETVGARYRELGVQLDEQVAVLAPAERVLVTNHDALGYLAERFGFDVVATVLPGTSTDAELSAAAFSELLAELDELGVTAVFTDAESSARSAEAVAAELDGVELVELYTGSLGAPGSGADTLEGMLRLNVERIVTALS